jgi:hypothetical protein
LQGISLLISFKTHGAQYQKGGAADEVSSVKTLLTKPPLRPSTFQRQIDSIQRRRIIVFLASKFIACFSAFVAPDSGFGVYPACTMRLQPIPGNLWFFLRLFEEEIAACPDGQSDVAVPRYRRE